MPPHTYFSSRKVRILVSLFLGVFSIFIATAHVHASNELNYDPNSNNYVFTDSGANIVGYYIGALFTPTASGNLKYLSIRLARGGTPTETSFAPVVWDSTRSTVISNCSTVNYTALPDSTPIMESDATYYPKYNFSCDGASFTGGTQYLVEFSKPTNFVNGGSTNQWGYLTQEVFSPSAPTQLTFSNSGGINNFNSGNAHLNLIINDSSLGACSQGYLASTTNITSNIAANTTWDSQHVYDVSGNIAINSGKTLTIQPCSVIKFATATSTLTVNGVLDAEGTSSPIYFTSYKDDTVGGDTNGDGTTTMPAIGDWKSIITSSTGSTTMSNVVARYGGSSGTSSPMIYNTAGKLTVVNSTIATSSSYGVGMAGGTVNLASTTLNNNSSGAAFINLTSGGTFTHATTTDSGNGVNGIVVTGTINANTEWTKDRTVSPIPYVPSGVVTIAAAKTLTIDPGVVVKFNNSSSGLSVSGTVTGQGNGGANTIFFTSIYDSETESSATSSPTTPAAGDWQDITVKSGGTVSLGNAVIRYGGHIATSTSAALLNNTGGTVTIGATSTIAYGTTYGIKNTTGTTTVTNADIAYNNYGLYLTGGSASITASSTIHNNSLYGVYNSTTATTTATGNYWGDNSGPYNALYNSGGLGNAVSNKVSFYPFIGGTGTTSQIHYIEAPGTTAVVGSQLTYTVSTAYAPELSSATTTWNSYGPIQILPATTTPNISISDYNNQDVAETGYYTPTATTSIVALNSYFLNNNTFAQIQNTITHELGHALGLDHSFTGNIMYFNQNSQTTLGSQDKSDYNCLWVTGACPH